MTEGCAIVTGAGSGIGAATTLALAAQGVDVVAVSRRPERLLSDIGSGASVNNLHVAAADLTIPEEVDRVFGFAESRFAAVRHVIHSVGHDYRIGWHREMDPAATQAAIAALLVSPALVLTRALQSMQASGGTIGFVSSGAAYKPTPGRALYSATKTAVNRLVESVAAECRDADPGVSVFAVLPGRVDTPMQQRLMQEARDAPAGFRLDRFTSSSEVRPAQEIGAALARLTLEPPDVLNGRILRYHPSGWERTNG